MTYNNAIRQRGSSEVQEITDDRLTDLSRTTLLELTRLRGPETTRASRRLGEVRYAAHLLTILAIKKYHATGQNATPLEAGTIAEYGDKEVELDPSDSWLDRAVQFGGEAEEDSYFFASSYHVVPGQGIKTTILASPAKQGRRLVVATKTVASQPAAQTLGVEQRAVVAIVEDDEANAWRHILDEPAEGQANFNGIGTVALLPLTENRGGASVILPGGQITREPALLSAGAYTPEVNALTSFAAQLRPFFSQNGRL